MYIKYIENGLNKELLVEVRHIKDGKKYELYVIPYTVEYNGNMVIRTNNVRKDKGFRYKVADCNRKSQKVLDRYAEIAYENSEDILECFLAGSYDEIISLFNI